MAAYDTLIDAYAQKGDLHGATICLVQMAKTGLELDMITHSALTNAPARKADTDGAMRYCARLAKVRIHYS